MQFDGDPSQLPLVQQLMWPAAMQEPGAVVHKQRYKCMQWSYSVKYYNTLIRVLYSIMITISENATCIPQTLKITVMSGYSSKELYN